MSEVWTGAPDPMTYVAEYISYPTHIWGWSALIVCFLAAWALARILRRVLLPRLWEGKRTLFQYARLAVASILFPGILALAAGLAAIVLESLGMPANVLGTATVLAGSLAAIQLAVYALTRALRPSPALAASERLIAWILWAIYALTYLGWLQPLARFLERVGVTVGAKRYSLLDGTRTALTVLVFVLIAAYLGRVIERRLMRATQLPAGVRIGLAKTVRLALIIFSALIAFNVLGIDLGGLTVFSGALGVGLGFGLQRIASNFISGFILIGDRSIRPGDVITVGTRFGVVRELRARYVVVRDRDGVDTLIPNENLITSEVINWSYSDRTVRLKLPVQISYRDDPRRAIALMLEVARSHPRIEKAPEAAGRVMGFGASGIDLELRVWIVDPEDGVNNVRSDLYLEIWEVFKATGITIPYPQQDVHLHRVERSD